MSLKMKQAMNSFASDGSFFAHIPTYGDMTAVQTAIVYTLRHSGQKSAGPLVENYVDVNGHLTGTGKMAIGNIITAMFKQQWDRKWEALITDYNALENYDMEEIGADDHTGTDAVSMAHGAKSSSDTIGGTSGSNTTGAQSNSSENEVSAFNSTTYQDANKTTDSLGERIDSYSDTGRNNSHSEASYTDNDTTTYNSSMSHTLRRHGNIGVTTSQQMLESELKLRAYNFYYEMFNDIDGLLCLKVYDWDDEFNPVYSAKDIMDSLKVERVAGGVKITATDSNGTTTAIIEDGVDGRNGVDGKTPEFKIENGDLYVQYE